MHFLKWQIHPQEFQSSHKRGLFKLRGRTIYIFNFQILIYDFLFMDILCVFSRVMKTLINSAPATMDIAILVPDMTLVNVEHLVERVFKQSVQNVSIKECNVFYIEFRQSFAKETFSYDEHLKS